jgi:hypothetical protein
MMVVTMMMMMIMVVVIMMVMVVVMMMLMIMMIIVMMLNELKVQQSSYKISSHVLRYNIQTHQKDIIKGHERSR